MRAWAAVCVLLPAALASASEVRIPAPGVTRIESPAVTRQGNWEVSVSFDPVLCEISCVYRLRGDRFGRAPVSDLLLPPAVDIRLFSDGVSAPSTVTVDPARTREPAFAPEVHTVREAVVVPVARATRKPAGPVMALSRAHTPRPPDRPSIAREAPVSLRI